MSSDLMERVRLLLPLLLEVEKEERQALLLKETMADLELREELKSLLAADPTPAEFLEDPALDLIEDLLPDASEGTSPQSLGVPRSLGRFQVLREVGRGGMGVVFKGFAESDQYRQPVALKVLRPGAAPLDLKKRLETEGRILARLRHANISRLMEGGETADGQFFLAMEFAPGEALDVYCRSRKIGVEERLQLMQVVCGAVQYAHRNLIVHRDLKPANIRVSDEGEVKLLDFGVGKLLRPDAAQDEAETLTLGMHRFLTPDYASPEQIRGEEVTTLTDVYSLGVLLYELLAGRRPYRLQGLSPGALERQVSERELPPPSQFAEAEGEEQTRRLRRRLAGDLDLIVAKAMHRDPDRRYATVEQLSEDIDRHLQGRPVQARGDSLGYRLGKLIRRHRLATALLLLVALAVLITAFVMVRQQRETTRERDRAQRVSELLVEVLGTLDPQRPAADPEGVLHRARQKIDEQLQADPETRVPLLLSLAEIYLAWDRFGTAEGLYTEAQALSLEAAGAQSPDLATALYGLGIVAFRQGRLDQADEYYLNSLAITEKLLPRSPGRVSNLFNARAVVAKQQGDLPAAEALYREALDAAGKAGGEPDPEVGVTHQNLANLLKARGKYQEAESEYLQSLKIFRGFFGPHHPRAALTLSGLAGLHRKQGRFDEAEAGYREALEIRRDVFGSSHTDVGSSLNSLGLLLVKQGRPGEGEPMLREALKIFEEGLSPEHHLVAGVANNLGMALQALGRYDAARVLYERAMTVWTERLGGEHHLLASGHSNLGDLARDQGRFGEAQGHFEKALAVGEAALGGDHPRVATYHQSLGVIALEGGRFDAAEELLQRALEIRRAKLPGDHPDTAGTLRQIGFLRLRQGRLAEAEELLAEALHIQEKKLAADALPLQRTRMTLAEAFLERGDGEAALDLARAVRESLRQKVPAVAAFEQAEADALLGRALLSLGRQSAGRDLLASALPILESHFGPKAWPVVRARAAAGK